MLEHFAEASRFLHVLFGAIGLTAFWLPVFAKKGGSLHVRAGKVFVWSAYVVLGAAALALLLRFVLLRLENLGPAERPMTFAMIVFLGYLTLVTFVVVRHGMQVLKHKRDPAAVGSPLSRALAMASIAASAGVVAYALLLNPPSKIILFALSPIGVLSGLGILRYANGGEASPRGWMYEHLGAMLGAGIAFHTAFAVFGVTRVFDIGLTGWVAVIPWIAPALIGVPATAIWTRYYRRRHGELA